MNSISMSEEWGRNVSRVREISLRVANAVLLSALSAVQRRFGSNAVYKVSKDGIAACFEGAWFTYRPREFGSTGNIDFEPEAENETRQAIFARLSGNETFYDIGAHGGIYTITLSRRFPNLVVHSFEPQPEDLIANLELNAVSTDNVHAVALGEQEGTVRMTTKERSSNHISDSGDREVPLVRLDDYVTKLSLPDPHWIKIDIEGMELPALHGAERILQRARPTIVCEINHISGRYGTKVADLTTYLGSLGYTIHALQDGQLNAIGDESLPYSADWNYWFLPS